MGSSPFTTDGDQTWFGEREPVGFEQRIQVRRVLYETRSPYQLIQVLDTAPFGTMLVLDRAVQTTAADEFTYHEMLVHPALTSVAHPQRVLIIGGGDGGCLRRVLQHPVQAAHLVEIDGQVIDVSRRYLEEIAAGAFDDPRAHLVLADGVEYVRQAVGPFDVVIIDSTDPTPSGLSHSLFSVEFYRDIRRLVGDHGVLVTQSGSPLFHLRELLSTVSRLRQVFSLVQVYLALIPSYPGVVWSFTVASSALDVAHLAPAQIEQRLAERGISPRYYHPHLHGASFILPTFLAQALAHPQQLAAQQRAYPVRYGALAGDP
ncbi:MAG: polyamine aminopropyltransferase [Chloroflexi bacterium]|nr:polyamine aminopropyltransferase [Chloroflexota bacterium]